MNATTKTTPTKGFSARYKAISLEKEEKEQELEYVRGKITELENDITKALSRAKHLREVSIPAYIKRAEGLESDARALGEEIIRTKPFAEKESEEEKRKAKIAELESELRKLQREMSK